MKVAAGLNVDRDSRHPGGSEVRHQIVGSGDHEMRIHGDSTVCGEPTDQRWPERQIGNEVAVHDVEVEEIGTGVLYLGDFSRQVGEVG